MAASALQIETNRANAQHSTGPRTDDGKQRSSLNAVRHGLTGQTIVMPHEDMQAYLAHCQNYLQEWKPAGTTESHILQSIADSQWRLHRAHAHQLTTDAMDPEQLGNDPALAEIERSKALDRISRYASRIQRDLQAFIKLLQNLQSERRVREHASLEQAKLLQKFFEMKQESWTPAEFGFVLTTTQINAHVRLTDHLDQAKKAKSAHYDLPKYQTATEKGACR